MGKKHLVDEDNVIALAKKCPDWKKGLSELFPDIFPRTLFPCGTIFLGRDEATLWQLRHAPGNKQYLLTDMWTGYNYKRPDKGITRDEVWIFHRVNNKEIEVPAADLGLRPVPKEHWAYCFETILCSVVPKIRQMSTKGAESDAKET